MKRICIIGIGLFLYGGCLGQIAFIEKVSKGKKAHLAIGVKTGDSTEWYFANCFFKPVTLLADTVKIRLIRKLLEFTSDTTMSNNQIYNLSGRYEMVKREPESKLYSLQIEALILINYIAFSSKSFYYSPFPLLYNKKTETEICCNGKELILVIKIYKEWFRRLERNGFIDYCYPLADNQYEWFGSKFVQQKFNTYPEWDKNFDCKELK